MRGFGIGFNYSNEDIEGLEPLNDYDTLSK